MGKKTKFDVFANRSVSMSDRRCLAAKTAEVSTSMHDSRDFDAIVDRAKKHDVVSHAETTTPWHAESRPLFAQHRMGGQNVAFLADRSDPSSGSARLVAGDVGGNVAQIFIRRSRVDYLWHVR